MKLSLKRPANYGLLTSLIAILLLLVLVLVNVAVNLLPRTVTVLDSSFNQLYTLSETTEERISALKEDVTVYFLCSDGTEDPSLRTFLDRYDALSDRVTVRVVDPKENPTFTSAYTDAVLSNYSIIIEGAKRSLAIDSYDLYLWENEALGILTYEEYAAMASDATGSYLLSYYPTVQHFNGESKLTNGISYVTADSVPRVYVTSNHSETALGSDLRATLKANAYELVEGFSLFSAGGVPKDCAVLLVNNPKSDLSADERTWIADYLASGGRLFLTTAADNAYGTEDETLPNLTALLAEYGLSAISGVIVEEDSSLSYSNYPVVLLPKPDRENPIFEGASGSTVVFYTAHGIRIAEGASGVTPLFTTSEKSYTAEIGTDDLYERTESSEDGPFMAAVLAERGKGRLVWFASAYALDDSIDSLVSGGNHTYAVSAFDHLTEKRDALALPSVSLEDPKLVITETTAVTLAIVFIGVVPFSVLFGGIFYIRKRRRA